MAHHPPASPAPRVARLTPAPRVARLTPAPRLESLTPGDQFALFSVAGIATGLAIVLLIDRLIAGPGLLAAFGL